MLYSLGAYLYERRRGITKVAGYVGGTLAVSRYVAEKLGEVRDTMVQDRLARDNLRRRFEQNSQDISFTIMALLPTLGQHILDGMDVEGVTQELQSYSKSSQRVVDPPPSESSMSSSLELRSDNGHDARSEISSMSMISGPEDPSSSHMASSSNSWVDQFPAAPSSGGHSQAPSSSGSDSHHNAGSPPTNKPPDLSDSILTSTDSSAMSYEESTKNVEQLSEETERKFLTLSWWILHVGWQDVGERVRRGVEEVFESVSLKTKLSAVELHRLVSDVRRRVEYEVTFEGKERRINFMSTLLPPTPETLQHVLTQGGIPSRLAAAPDAAFQELLYETRTHVASANLQRVLEVCLDRATETLFDGLEKNVFFDSAVGLDEASSTGLGLVPDSRVRLAGMLPGLGRWCRLALEGLPNELIDGLAAVREVSAFSAIIYSSYEDQFSILSFTHQSTLCGALPA
ncbi:hypothetical protein EUX98_g7781 [Antrodiella citrinella]|uniref:Peroxin-3 n=1 Tax=Antrodiella citrinella TaxID=2447956 RepID=A0A4S4MMJ5_9APHY|nr:hypothetical protein EUX98_g7781 [Antrodiella citrinella]